MRKIQVVVFFFTSLLAFGCQGQGAKPTRLDPHNFERKLNSTKDKVLIDVRTQDEFSEGHLVNALLIDFFSKDFKAQISKLDKAKPVFVYCGTGNRSGKASMILIDMGFAQVFDLTGGTEAWSDANKKIVR